MKKTKNAIPSSSVPVQNTEARAAKKAAKKEKKQRKKERKARKKMKKVSFVFCCEAPRGIDNLSPPRFFKLIPEKSSTVLMNAHSAHEFGTTIVRASEVVEAVFV